MEAKAFSLLREDKENIIGLTAIAQNDYLSNFNSVSQLDLSLSDKSKTLKDTSNAFIDQYFPINENVSSLMYDKNRELDIDDSIEFDTSDFSDLSYEAKLTTVKAMNWAVDNKSENIWFDEALSAALILLIGGILTKSLLQGRVENYNKFGKKDSRFKRTKRLASASACAYCIEKSISSYGSSDYGYHKFCRCSIGLFWDGSNSDKYQNNTFIKYEEERAKVLADLQSDTKNPTTSEIIKELRSQYGYR